MKYAYLLTAVAACAVATSASALTIISATVRGQAAGVNSGTVWTAGDPAGTNSQNYTLFLQTPNLGDYLNPNDEAIALTPVLGENRVFLAGDGFPIGTTLDSDLTYQLTLGFDGNRSLTGTYTPTTNTFLGGQTTIVENGVNYALNEFSFRRFLGNPVGPYQAIAGTGDGNDYVGNFRLTATAVSGAVPEPATWAMMIGGFGVIGGVMRRRRTLGTVATA